VRPSAVLGRAVDSFNIRKANFLVLFFNSSAFIILMADIFQSESTIGNWQLAIGNIKLYSPHQS